LVAQLPFNQSYVPNSTGHLFKKCCSEHCGEKLSESEATSGFCGNAPSRTFGCNRSCFFQTKVSCTFFNTDGNIPHISRASTENVFWTHVRRSPTGACGPCIVLVSCSHRSTRLFSSYTSGTFVSLSCVSQRAYREGEAERWYWLVGDRRSDPGHVRGHARLRSVCEFQDLSLRARAGREGPEPALVQLQLRPGEGGAAAAGLPCPHPRARGRLLPRSSVASQKRP